MTAVTLLLLTVLWVVTAKDAPQDVMSLTGNQMAKNVFSGFVVTKEVKAKKEKGGREGERKRERENKHLLIMY